MIWFLKKDVCWLATEKIILIKFEKKYGVALYFSMNKFHKSIK